MNELIKAGLIERTNNEGYKRTKELEKLLEDAGMAYWGQPWSYYLSKRQSRQTIYKKLDNAPKKILIIIEGLLIGLLVAYLVYKFGWNK